MKVRNFDDFFEEKLLTKNKRLIKRSGILLCHAKNSPLLESSFKLIFSEHQEYEIAPNEKILITRYAGTSWGKKEETNLREKKAELACELQQAIASGSLEIFRPLVQRIDLYINKAAEIYDIRSKTELLRLKELVLDYMLNIGDEFEGVYKERLQGKLM